LMYPSAELEGFPEFVISLEKQLAEGLPNRAASHSSEPCSWSKIIISF
jgi:hypothetical protein